MEGELPSLSPTLFLSQQMTYFGIALVEVNCRSESQPQRTDEELFPTTKLAMKQDFSAKI